MIILPVRTCTLDKYLLNNSMKYFNTSQLIASNNFKKLLQQLYVDSQKIFGTTNGVGSHTNTTTQLVIKRRIQVPLNAQSIKLVKVNSLGLFNNKFSITIFENSVSQLQSRTKLKKNGFMQTSNCPATQLTSSCRVQKPFFRQRPVWFGICNARAIFGLTVIHPVIRIQYFLEDLPIFFVGYFVSSTSLHIHQFC